VKLSIYERAENMRDEMSVKTYMSHMNKIQGRFHLAAETEDAKIIGLLGNVYWHDLSPVHKAHIAAYYMLPGHDMEHLPDYPVSINRSMYTGFIKIKK
jgi:hypothetical protein